MRFLKGKSPKKKLKSEKNRATGAPILGFLDHNPKFAKKGGVIDPPLYSRPICSEGGGQLLLFVLMVLC